MLRTSLAAVVAVLFLAGCLGGDRVIVSPQQLPAAKVGESYDVALSASWPSGSNVGPFSVSVTKGSLPPGISTSQPPGDGTGGSALRGTPTNPGSYTFTVELAGYCTMGGCTRGSRDYTLVVDQ